jgi:2-polyprenyl-6-hydroxyphenyl methylase/3-demethylubiquinone-9 3-methyltransferase
MGKLYSASAKGGSYYAQKLSATRLKQVYDLASEPVRRYLAAEIAHVKACIPPGGRVLELGCGYGRVLKALTPPAGTLVGIDTSHASLDLARDYLAGLPDVMFVLMDAMRLAFSPATFDLVCCIQNGISAFRVDQRTLLAAAVDVTRPGGRVLFSSYAEAFWDHRLAWFRLQAREGLLGEIDEAATGRGVIVCKDGFRATTVTPDQFRSLSRGLGRQARVDVVADASVFCEILV